MSVEVEVMRECRKCRALLPLGEFTRNRHCRLGRSYLCKRCDGARKRASERAVDPTSSESTRRLIDNAPDPAIPETIRRVLAVHRAKGAPFPTAWRASLAIALAGLGPRERAEWLACCSWALPVWRASYHRQRWPEPFVEAVVPGPAAEAA